MKKSILIFLFAFYATHSFSQNNYQDVVYLKNGGVIHGVIIEQVPNKSVKIQTTDKNVFVYQFDEIEKLTREPFKSNSGFYGTNSGLVSGYRGISEIGYQFGVGTYGLDRLKLNIVNGYQFNPYLAIGFGTGLRYYFENRAALIPVFCDFRVNFKDKIVSPYLSVGAGYTFDATNSFEEVGFLFNPALGISFKVAENSAMNIGIGYEMQNMIFEKFHDYMSYIDYYNYYHKYYQNFLSNSSAISLNVGISY
jgi:hypothetical protein